MLYGLVLVFVIADSLDGQQFRSGPARSPIDLSLIDPASVRARRIEELRSRLSAAEKQADHTAVVRHAADLRAITALAWRQWRSVDGAHEQLLNWRKATDAYVQAVETMDIYEQGAIENLVRKPPRRVVQRWRRGRPRVQAFVDAQWVYVRGGLNNARGFVLRERAEIEPERMRLLLHLGKLQRDKSNELLAAEMTFRNLAG